MIFSYELTSLPQNRKYLTMSKQHCNSVMGELLKGVIVVGLTKGFIKQWLNSGQTIYYLLHIK